MSTPASRYLGRLGSKLVRLSYRPMPGEDPFMAGQRVMRQRCADAVRQVSVAAERKVWEVAVSAAPLKRDTSSERTTR